eukprot:Gb_40099 [translate_table: standard]
MSAGMKEVVSNYAARTRPMASRTYPEGCLVKNCGPNGNLQGFGYPGSRHMATPKGKYKRFCGMNKRVSVSQGKDTSRRQQRGKLSEPKLFAIKTDVGISIRHVPSSCSAIASFALIGIHDDFLKEVFSIRHGLPSSSTRGDAHLQCIDTNLGKELKIFEIIRTYNDIYREVERADRLYTDWEELSEDEDQYRSDMLSLKASGLHRIAAKPEVFPCKDLPDMVYTAESAMAFFKGKDSVKEVLRGWAEEATKIKHRPSIDYPISYFRKGIRIGMAMLNRLWGKADTDRVDQLWVPLLGFIIAQDRRPDFAEILVFNLHQNWRTAKEGNSFFMASYVVDACGASLRFDHPQFPEWPHQSEAPIHTLFEPLYIYKYHLFITTIYEYFYPMHGGSSRTTPSSESKACSPRPISCQCMFQTDLQLLKWRHSAYLAIPGQVREGGGSHEFVGQVYREDVGSFRQGPESLSRLAGQDESREADDARREKEDADDTEEVLTMNILRGLSTGETLIPDPTGASPVPPAVIHTPPSWVIPQKEASPPAHVSTSVPQTPEIMVPPISASTEKIFSGTSPALPPPIPEPLQEPEDTRVEITRTPTHPEAPHTFPPVPSSTAPREEPVLTTSDIPGPTVASPSTRDMKRGASQKDAEGDQPIPHSSHHEARWEAYLMAKEMMKSLEADISTLDISGSSRVRSHPAPIPRGDPLSGPSSTGQPILEQIDKDNPMHDEERDRSRRNRLVCGKVEPTLALRPRQEVIDQQMHKDVLTLSVTVAVAPSLVGDSLVIHC